MTANIKALINQIDEILSKYGEISKISGENFNIFRTIDLTTDEVRLHSKFLAELLNPKGSHGQGDIFLSLFLREFDITNYKSEKAKVFVEKHIGNKTETTGGRIDILIEDENKKTIIIENKINAEDQENQLIRYYNYSRFNVFYLTLFGDEPTKESCGELIVDTDFKIISYKTDIVNWLEKCRKETALLPLLREGLTHYINLIKYLTGQSINTTMEKEIRDLIVSSPQNLKTAITISNNTEDAKVKLQWLFWKNLKEQFEKSGIDLLNEKESKTVTWDKIKSFYSKTRNRDKFYGLWSKIYDKDNITIHYGVEIESNIYFGFTVEKNNKGGIANKTEYEKIRSIISELSSEYHLDSQWWLGWRYVNPQLNFRNFNTDEIYNLADRENLHNKVAEIVEISVYDIAALKQRLNDLSI